MPVHEQFYVHNTMKVSISLIRKEKLTRCSRDSRNPIGLTLGPPGSRSQWVKKKVFASCRILLTDFGKTTDYFEMKIFIFINFCNSLYFEQEFDNNKFC